MSLDQIKQTKHSKPPRIVLHGPEGVGKSSFMAGAPSPIFIPTEDGLSGIDAQAFPVAASLDEVFNHLQTLANEEHDFKTVVVDSADWLEALIEKAICVEDNVDNIVLAKGGYGKGFSYLVDRWRGILAWLDYLNTQKGMIVGLTAHSVVTSFNDPEHEPYDRYELKLYSSKKATGSRDLLLEWADIVGFANTPVLITQKEDTTTRPDQNGNRAKIARAIPTAEAINQLHLRRSPAFTAKNRYNLPPVCDLSWTAFQDTFSQ